MIRRNLQSGADEEFAGLELQLSQLFAVLIRYRYLMLAAIITFAILGWLAARYVTPVYRVDALLAPNMSSPDARGAQLGALSGLSSIVGLNLNEGSVATDEAVAVLRSRQFLERFITDEDLLPILFPDQWNPTTGSWLANDGADVPTLWDGYSRLSDDVMYVSVDRNTGFVTLAIEWVDAVQAVQWVHDLVQRLNDVSRIRVIEESQKSINFLESELASTSVVEIRQVIFRLIESELKTVTLANAREDYAFRVIDPPRAPDDDAYVWPKVYVFVATGMVTGFFIGFVCALWLRSRKANKGDEYD
jgi:hypothetical protein